jgi:ADP-ribose pyrophosphatase
MVAEKVVSTEFVFKGRAVNLRIDTVEMPGGRRTTREIVEHPDCVAIVPVDAQGNVLLVRQYRHAPGKELLEIPAGGIDPGEDAETAVKREMGEETGFSPRSIKRLGGFYSSPGFCTEYLHLFLATDLVPNRLEAEDTVGIQVVKVRPEDLEGLIRSEVICDSKSIAGIYMYLRTRR